jgi:predicted nucleic acid-binding protein
MNLVDSSGWLEYFADGENADSFAPVIENTDELIVSVINLYEVYKKILIENGKNPAIQAIALMQQPEVIKVDELISITAAGISFELKLPMADSIIYATAKMHDATIWTQDSDFEGLPNVKFFKH